MRLGSKIMLIISSILLFLTGICAIVFVSTGYTLKIDNNENKNQEGTSFLDINYLYYDIDNSYKTKIASNEKKNKTIAVGDKEIDYEPYNSFSFNLYTLLKPYDRGFIYPELAHPGFDIPVKGPFYFDLEFSNIYKLKSSNKVKILKKKLSSILDKKLVYLKTTVSDGISYYSFVVEDSLSLEVYSYTKNGEKRLLRSISNKDIVKGIKSDEPILIKNDYDLAFVDGGRVYVDLRFQEIISDELNLASFVNRKCYSVNANKNENERGILLPTTGIKEKQPFQLNYIDSKNDKFIYRRESKLALRDNMKLIIMTDLYTRNASLKISRYNIATNEYTSIYQEGITKFLENKTEINLDSSSFKSGRYRFTLIDIDDNEREYNYDYYLERSDEE